MRANTTDRMPRHTPRLTWHTSSARELCRMGTYYVLIFIADDTFPTFALRVNDMFPSFKSLRLHRWNFDNDRWEGSGARIMVTNKLGRSDYIDIYERIKKILVTNY